MENENQAKPQEAGKKKSRKKWIIIAVAVIIFYAIGSSSLKKAKEQANIQKEQKIEVSKSVNVQSTVQNETKKPEPKAGESKNWYEGGTLHKATVAEWKSATEENKLATSADFMASVDSSVSMDELKDRATDLKKCIDSMVNNVETKTDEPVVNIAGLCAVAGGYKAN